MTKPNRDDTTKPKASSHSDVVTTRVNVAFPFSQIKVQEPSEELAELAELVRAIADLLVDVAPGPKQQELAQHAQALAARIQGGRRS